jgi:thymidylate synthase (FAD)
MFYLMKPKPKIELRSTFDVALVDYMGDDTRICQAARVSTAGAASYSATESAGLINFLMKNRHGSPFEHVMITWMISSPIFVWREFMRHRIASYNEESGRYTQLKPVFYVPSSGRPLRQVGKTGAYEFVAGNPQQYKAIQKKFFKGAQRQYKDYLDLLDLDVAKEVARMELPLNIYSTTYVTMNARGLMNFLSLRVKSNDSTFKSFPQWEISQVAEQMERTFEYICPITHAAFVENGRVCP